MEPKTLVILIVIGILIILSAFFSSCEVTYSSVNKIKLKKKVNEGSKKATKAMNIVNNFSDVLSTILVGNNLVNILASSLATVIAVEKFGEDKGSIIATISLTIVVLIFGEIIPKVFAKKYSLRMSLLYVTPFRFFKGLFFPITFVVSKGMNIFKKFWTPKEIEPSVTDEELIDVINREAEKLGISIL